MFKVGAACEAVDSEGHWERGTIVTVEEGESFKVSFDGWGTRFDRWVLKEEIRIPTEIGK